MKNSTNCETCSFYVYDDEYECYYCQMNLDEDEMYKFLAGSNYNCAYYRLDNEYKIVQKQN